MHPSTQGSQQLGADVVEEAVMVEMCYSLPHKGRKDPWVANGWVNSIEKGFNGVPYLTS